MPYTPLFIPIPCAALAPSLLSSTGGKNGAASQRQMSAFHALALCRAGCEINLALTAHTRELHSAIQEKYKYQVDEILTWENLPKYVTRDLFSHEDVNQKKKYGQDGAKMWRKWIDVKRSINNRDNVVVKKVIAGQPGSAIPSGGVMNAKSKFWTELTDGLYAAEKTIGKIGDQGLGGSASKAATAEGDHGDDRDSHDSTEEGGCEDEGAGDCAATAESMKRGAHSVQARDGQGKGVKKARRSMESLAAPEGYIPQYLGVIANIGVLSSHPQEPLDYAIKEATDESTSVNRDDLRKAAADSKRSSVPKKAGAGSAASAAEVKAHALSDFAASKAKDVLETRYSNDLLAWQLEVTARKEKLVELEQVVKMAKEDLKEIKDDDDDDFESEEEHDAAIKKAKDVLKGYRKALMEHLSTPKPLPPTRAHAPAPSPAPSPADPRSP